jgi:hypothetical protein
VTAIPADGDGNTEDGDGETDGDDDTGGQRYCGR